MRDGVLEKIMLTDIDTDNTTDIIVIARSVVTGGYLSAYSFTVKEAQLVFHSATEGLPENADPVEALKKAVPEQK